MKGKNSDHILCCTMSRDVCAVGYFLNAPPSHHPLVPEHFWREEGDVRHNFIQLFIICGNFSFSHTFYCSMKLLPSRLSAVRRAWMCSGREKFRDERFLCLWIKIFSLHPVLMMFFLSLIAFSTQSYEFWIWIFIDAGQKSWRRN